MKTYQVEFRQGNVLLGIEEVMASDKLNAFYEAQAEISNYIEGGFDVIGSGMSLSSQDHSHDVTIQKDNETEYINLVLTII